MDQSHVRSQNTVNFTKTKQNTFKFNDITLFFFHKKLGIIKQKAV